MQPRADQEGCLEVVAELKDALYPIHCTLAGASYTRGLDFQPSRLPTMPLLLFFSH